jgi:dihydropteroate synthase
MDLDQILTKKKVLIMGVLNVTPDSFSDGGLYADPGQASARARNMIEEGADMIDIGAESSRPGALPVSLEEELSRLRPLLAHFTKTPPAFPFSIDTSKAAVAQEALAAGAVLVNDISAGQQDSRMFSAVRAAGAGIILMHMKGSPRSMQEAPSYRDVMEEVSGFFEERLAAARAAGIPEEKLFLDPGIGFGKTMEHNLDILARLEELARWGRPLVVGTSRKSFIGGPVSDRLGGTVASSLWAVMKGARVLRVHDVKACAQAVALWGAMANRTVQQQFSGRTN